MRLRFKSGRSGPQNGASGQKQSFLRRKLENFLLTNHVLMNVEFNDNGEHRVHWLRTAGSEFHDPLFTTTVNRILMRSQRRAMLTTGIDALLRQGSREEHVCPSGFIYHLGRCGSTLLSNMLKVGREHFVLSEPDLPVSAMLFKPGLCSEAQWEELTQASIRTFGGIALLTSKRFFIKFVSIETMAIPLIRKTIPNVPEVFLYRDPIEVTMSMIARPVLPWLLWENLTGVPVMAAIERPLAELTARIVGRILDAMCSYVREDTLLLNYSQIDTTTPKLVLSHFRAQVSPSLSERMARELDFYSKDRNRSQSFVADSEKKQQSASLLIRDVVTEYAMKSYRKLEQLRTSKG